MGSIANRLITAVVLGLTSLLLQTAHGASAASAMGPLAPNLLRGHDGPWQGELEAGTYRLRNGSDPGAIYYIYTEPDRSEDQGLHVSVEVAGDWAGGTSRAGLIYGLDPNAPRYYAFVLDRDGTIALLRRGDQGLEAVLSTETEAVRPQGSNQLSVVEEAGTLHLQVNGQELASIENEDVGTGAVGIVAMGEGTYRFRDFRVSAGQQRRTDRIQEPQRAAESEAYQRMRMVRLMDSQGFGRPAEALRLLVPSDWQVEGQVNWTGNVGCPMELVKVHLLAMSPDGALAFEVFPNRSWGWSDDAYMRQMMQQAPAMYGTQPCDMAPPLDAAEFLRQVLIPQQRGEVEELSAEPLPDAARQFEEATRAAMGPQLAGSGVQIATDAARVRVAHRHDGRPVEEQLTAVVFHNIAAMPGTGAMLGYGTGQPSNSYSSLATHLYGMRAPRGDLEAHSDLFATMLSSLRVNPAWDAAVARVILNIGQAQIQGAAERSRIIAETSREISQMQQQSWEQQQRTKDLMAERFSRYVRGVTRYQDPATGEQLELASGYAQAWRSGDEYILAQDPSFDPNTVSQQGWTRLRALE